MIEEDIEELGGDVQELLLVYNHPEQQLAVHLEIFSLEDAAAVSSRPETDYLYVIVFTVADHEIGLLVSELVDITS